jgi:hypothetical protein
MTWPPVTTVTAIYVTLNFYQNRTLKILSTLTNCRLRKQLVYNCKGTECISYASEEQEFSTLKENKPLKE